jgi:outer membrane protein OmpA-like peptidoglycan-associated protein
MTIGERRRKSVAVACALSALAWGSAAVAGDAHRKRTTIIGTEVGIHKPTGAYSDFTNNGVGGGLFAAHMPHKNFGLQANLELDGADERDERRADQTGIFGALIGPRLALPILATSDRGGRGDLEVFSISQVGFFTGLASDASVTDSSIGFSVGAGLDIAITDRVLLGAYGRWNRLYQRVHGVSDVEYVNAGVLLAYDLTPAPAAAPPPPPPPPPPPAPAPPPPTRRKIVLRGVNFDFDKSDVRADAQVILNEAITVLQEERGIAVSVEGHTDDRGTDEYNQRLAVRRAAAVRDYLVAGGVAADRLSIAGFGEARPVATNDTDDGRAQNRRVELRIVESSGE